MNNKLTFIFAIGVLLFLQSCEKEATRIPDFLVEFATVKLDDPFLTFRLDNGTVLKPKIDSEFDLNDRDRIILNYTPLEKEFITINSVRKIFLDIIKEKGYPDNVMTSPIKIISIWVSGHYLNMSFEVDYHSKSHIANLFKDPDAEEPTLYFSYSREEDPPGAPVLTHLSFDIESLNKKAFTVYVNTYDGMREFIFKTD